jgi:uncharacterized protein YdhG (YjbR/CyaY superfamily)
MGTVRQKKKGGVSKSGSRGTGASAKAAKDKRIIGRAKKASTGAKRGVKTVEDYFARLPEAARSRLQEMRAAIRSAVPAEAVEIISYQIPAFKTKKVLVWYAGFSKHCSLFPTASLIEEFRDELAGFTVSKGTIQFPIEQALPTALIKKLVNARVAQV